MFHRRAVSLNHHHHGVTVIISVVFFLTRSPVSTVTHVPSGLRSVPVILMLDLHFTALTVFIHRTGEGVSVHTHVGQLSARFVCVVAAMHNRRTKRLPGKSNHPMVCFLKIYLASSPSSKQAAVTADIRSDEHYWHSVTGAAPRGDDIQRSLRARLFIASVKRKKEIYSTVENGYRLFWT